MAQLYDFQARAIKELLKTKHFIISGVGSGKTAMALVWSKLKCEQTNKHNVLIVTTASKSKTGDFEQEEKIWNGDGGRSLTVLSWHKLSAWVNEKQHNVSDYVVVFDEVQRAKAGVSS